MKPVIALVGRPNVGKSTLFNRLTRSRDAIVHDVPGVTRDRHYGEGRMGDRAFIAIDTGGLEPARRRASIVEMARQAEQAIAEADAVRLRGRRPRRPHRRRPRRSPRELRRLSPPVYARREQDRRHAGGHRGRRVPRARPRRAGGRSPARTARACASSWIWCSRNSLFRKRRSADEAPEKGHPRVAIVGRPNVGKSTLINALVGEERVIAFDKPGTTRDPIEVPFERGGRRYTLIDTAGVRRRGKTGTPVEFFSIVKALQAIEAANVAILTSTRVDGITEQDAHVAGYILERGRALVLAVNKWDAADKEQRDRMKSELQWKLGFLNYAEVHTISAKEGKGMAALMRSVDAAYAAAMARLSTPKLTRALIAAIEKQAPPKDGVIRPKLRYAHQGGVNPPRIIIHGNALDRVPDTYKRYLEGYFRNKFELIGTPMAIELRTGRNPYAGKAQKKRR